MIGSGFLLNLDWLAFSVRLVPSPTEKDCHEFHLSDISGYGFHVVEFNGTNVYARRSIVYAADGSKVITLLWHPLSKVLAYDICLVEVANEYLYDHPVSLGDCCYNGISWVMELVGLLHPCTFLCLSRVDISCDFQLTPDRAAFVKQLASNSIYVQRFSEGSMFHLFENVKGSPVVRMPKQLSWGSKKSNLKWKLYNKSLEVFEFVREGDNLRRHCSKPYIVRLWENAGLDISNVWRLECSLSPLARYKWRGRKVTLADLNNYFFISDLFGGLYTHKFATRLNEGHSDRSNDRRVWLLGNMGLFDNIEPAEPSSTREVAEYVSCLRAAMLQRSKVEVQVNSQMLRLWTATATECVRLGHLESYFQRIYGFPVEDIEDHVEIDLQRF